MPKELTQELAIPDEKTGQPLIKQVDNTPNGDNGLQQMDQGLKNLQEELEYLRAKVAIQEQVHRHPEGLELGKNKFESTRTHKKVIRDYSAEPVQEVLHKEYVMEEYESAGTAIGLKQEEHDRQVDELLLLAQEKGIKNALTISQKIGSPHLEDDLHRVLVQYIAEGMPADGLRHTGELWQAMHMTLYKVSISGSKSKQESDKAEELEKLLGAMEQLYLGMLSSVEGKSGLFGLKNNNKVFTVEIAVSEGSEEVAFYVSVPRGKKDLFERHLLSIFPDALIEEQRNDYNIFNNSGESVGAEAHLERYGAYPIKVYKKFTHDPLNIILSAFSKLQKHGEGAALQFVIGDDGAKANKKYKKIIDSLRKGDSQSEAIAKHSGALSKAWSGFKMRLSNSDNNDGHSVDQIALDLMTQKASTRIVPVALRAVSSAATLPRAQDILENLTSTFNQFDEGQGNGISWKQLRGGKLSKMLRGFIMRIFSNTNKMPLSIEELTTVYHLTGQAVSTSRELKHNRAKYKPAPIEMSDVEGITLGKNVFGASETMIKFSNMDRMRHFYEIGQTGTGKTFLMKQMIIQDILNGDGCCYIDPHGSDILDVLASVPEHRRKDVIYFDPGYIDMPMGLNFMEFDKDRPEQKTFVVNELFQIFMQLFGKKSPESMGPMFEQYFRNSTMLILEGMEHGTATIGDISRVLSDTEFRHQCLANSKNPVVNQFWEEVAEKAGGEASLENIVPYITAKTDLFMANEIMRPIIAQSKSAFSIPDIMNNKKILLVNLSKGRIGEMNAELLGLIFVSKILQAALERVDLPESERHAFYLYIDEFQNFTTPSIATILSEARKYSLSLNLAHQYIKQLSDEIREAVFGNVGTKCVFRVSHEDAEFLEKEFQPEFTAGDIAGLSNRHSYIKMLVDGSPAAPFDMQTMEVNALPDLSNIEELKHESYNKYGRPRAEVEAEIQERYIKKKPIKVQNTDPFAGITGL